MKAWWKLVLAFLVGVMVAWMVLPQWVETVRVHGRSMEPTLQEGDRLVLLKVGTPKRGDLVVIKGGEGKYIVKRVLGVSGDVVAFRDHVLYRNGERVQEPYVKEPMEMDEMDEIRVPSGTLYLLGDNRNISADSRLHGSYAEKDLLGIVKGIEKE